MVEIRETGRSGILTLGVLALTFFLMPGAGPEAGAQSHPRPTLPSAPLVRNDRGTQLPSTRQGAASSDPAVLASDPELRNEPLGNALRRHYLSIIEGRQPGLICPGDGSLRGALEAIEVVGVHLYEPSLELTRRIPGDGRLTSQAATLRGVQPLKATVYFYGSFKSGCPGQIYRGALDLERLADGHWFVPSWFERLNP